MRAGESSAGGEALEEKSLGDLPSKVTSDSELSMVGMVGMVHMQCIAKCCQVCRPCVSGSPVQIGGTPSALISGRRNGGR